MKREHRDKLLGQVVIDWMTDDLPRIIRQEKRLNDFQRNCLLESLADGLIKDARTTALQKEKLRQLVRSMRHSKRHRHKRRDDMRQGIEKVAKAIGRTPIKHAVMSSTPSRAGDIRGVSGRILFGSGDRLSISSDDSQTVELRQKLVERDAEIARLESELLAAHSQIEEQAKRYDARLEKQNAQIEEQRKQIAQLVAMMQGQTQIEKEGAISKEN